MREILFRGQDRMGDWVYGWYVYGPKNTGSHFIVSYNAYGTIMWYEVDPATVGQYTGLTDKNGKKIFEGDIWDCSGCIGVIEWVKEVCSFEASYMINGIEYANGVSDYRAAKVEVIGNIHDNPELLGKEAESYE